MESSNIRYDTIMFICNIIKQIEYVGTTLVALLDCGRSWLLDHILENRTVKPKVCGMNTKR